MRRGVDELGEDCVAAWMTAAWACSRARARDSGVLAVVVAMALVVAMVLDVEGAGTVDWRVKRGMLEVD